MESRTRREATMSLAREILDGRVREIASEAPKRTMDLVEMKWHKSKFLGDTGIDIGSLGKEGYDFKGRRYLRYERTKDELGKRRSKKRQEAFALMEKSEIDVVTIVKRETDRERKKTKIRQGSEKEVFVILAYERLPGEYKGNYKVDSSGTEKRGMRVSRLDRLLVSSIRNWASKEQINVDIEIESSGKE